MNEEFSTVSHTRDSHLFDTEQFNCTNCDKRQKFGNWQWKQSDAILLPMSEQNQGIIDEANQGKKWFPAVKTAPTWGKVSSKTQTISSREGDTIANQGDVICKGPGGEIWVQGAAKFNKKYVTTGEKDGEGYEKYLPNPETSRVFAAKIDHPFEVETSWGVLSGQPGDYLLKSAEDEKVTYPKSVWVVGADIFAATYKKAI